MTEMVANTAAGTTVVTGSSEEGAVSVSGAARAAAPKKTKLMLTELERIVEEACIETGDVPATALRDDQILAERIVQFVQGDVRRDRIQARLNNNPTWLRHQIAKLRAGVREDENERAVLTELGSDPLADPDFVNKALDEAREADRAAGTADGIGA